MKNHIQNNFNFNRFSVFVSVVEIKYSLRTMSTNLVVHGNEHEEK
jgi:hypothetical protein